MWKLISLNGEGKKLRGEAESAEEGKKKYHYLIGFAPKMEGHYFFPFF